MEASARCDCSQFVLQLPGVSCDIKDQTIHRSGLVWVGSVKDENQTVENVITAKYCPLNYCKREDISVDVNQPDTQCEFNHSGILCGGCQPGLNLMLGGVQCEVCSNRNLALIIPFLLGGVVLVFFLIISNLTTSEGFINSLVFYASIVKANEHIFLPQANTKPGVWSPTASEGRHPSDISTCNQEQLQCFHLFNINCYICFDCSINGILTY